MFPSVQIDLPPTMVITKGLPGKYTAVQMHLHWGGWDLEASGAEHTVDGIRYMAEVGLKFGLIKHHNRSEKFVMLLLQQHGNQNYSQLLVSCQYIYLPSINQPA